MIPPLPVAEVRAALATDDFDGAGSLLERHHHAVRAALAGIDLSNTPLAPWQALLATQQALAAEIRQARDEAAAAIDKIGRDQRGARAWQQVLA